MSWLILIIVGGIIGWIASLIMGTDSQQGLILNIVVGVVGSLLGKWLFSDVLGFGGAAAAGTFTLAGLLWGVIGAIILILILKVLNVFR